MRHPWLIGIVLTFGSIATASAEPAPKGPSSRSCDDDTACLAVTCANILALEPHARELRLDAAIVFQPGTARVYSASRERLQALAEAWRAHPRWGTIVVEGYATGKPSEALALAQHRAERIRTYLVRYGVASEHLVAVGRAPERTPAVRGKDNRVDLAITLCEGTATRCTPGAGDVHAAK